MPDETILGRAYKPKIQNQNLNVLIYGSQGVGKTTLAGTAQDHPAMRDVLFYNIEGGALSVIGRQMDTIDIHSINDLEKSFWEIRQELVNGTCKYKTVVIDSGTEMQTLATEASATEGMAKAARHGKERDRDDIYLEDYGKSTAQVARLMRWYRDLPINVIITALPGLVFPPGNNQNAAPIECRPEFTKKLSARIMGYVDFVWYMYQNEGQRFLLTSDQGIYRAKTRGNRFAARIGQVVANPNLTDLYNIMLEEEGKEDDPRATASPSSSPSSTKRTASTASAGS